MAGSLGFEPNTVSGTHSLAGRLGTPSDCAALTCVLLPIAHDSTPKQAERVRNRVMAGSRELESHTLRCHPASNGRRQPCRLTTLIGGA